MPDWGIKSTHSGNPFLGIFVSNFRYCVFAVQSGIIWIRLQSWTHEWEWRTAHAQERYILEQTCRSSPSGSRYDRAGNRVCTRPHHSLLDFQVLLSSQRKKPVKYVWFKNTICLKRYSFLLQSFHITKNLTFEYLSIFKKKLSKPFPLRNIKIRIFQNEKVNALVYKTLGNR